jgi:hypothetical protein
MSNGNRRDTCPRNIFSVSAHAKFSIILHITITQRGINVKRYCFAIYPRSTPALFCAQSMCVTLGLSTQATR